MKYLILFVIVLFAPVMKAQVVDNDSETRIQAVEREWGQQRELKDMIITEVKQHITEALLEPDECYHPRESLFGVKAKKITLKELRAELAHQYKRRSDLDKEYLTKWKALTAK